jgi:TM2 domain-containing membrane protein YozV
MTSTAYPNAQAIFYHQYETVRRDEVVGILLALFLGTFGIHHFYLRRTGLGVLYCCFFWTGITSVLGVVECFFMPGRVREFNAIQAAGIAAALGMNAPPMGWPVSVTVNMPPASYTQSVQGVTQPETLTACKHCQRTNPQGARFCAGCGTAL